VLMHARAGKAKGSLGCLFHLGAGISGRSRRNEAPEHAGRAGK
jgi:hypothetical protein